jgi:butyryl-CoA dehydrogenase
LDFKLSDQQRLIRDAAREFAQKEVAKKVEEMEEKDEFPLDLWREAGKLGFCGIPYPEKYGGAGGDYVSFVLMEEEIAKESTAFAAAISAHNLAVSAIYEFGTEEQRQRYLPKLLSGERIGSFAFTEPDTGSDPKAIKTTATPYKDGYMLNGHKRFITNAPFDGPIIVFAKDETGRISAFIVEKNCKGYSTGEPIKKMGMRGLISADVFLDDVYIPKENLLGKKSDGFNLLLDIISNGRLGIAAQCVGLTEAALKDAIKYAKERVQFGKPIGHFLTIQWLLSDIATSNEAARWLTYRTAFLKDQGFNIRVPAAMAKLFASSVAVEATRKAMQVLGSYGYTKDFRIERLYRDAKLAELYESTSEVLRVIIASDLLKLK